MMETIAALAALGTAAHGFCLANFDPVLVSGIALSNVATALAYVVGIPFMILPWVVVSKRPHEWAPVVCALILVGFIIFCGGGHLIDVAIIWWGSPEAYMVKIAEDIATAVISWAFPIAVLVAGRLGWRIKITRQR